MTAFCRRPPAELAVKVCKNQHGSALCSLPVELRLVIYAHLFGERAPSVNDPRVLHVQELPSKSISELKRKDHKSVHFQHTSAACHMRFSGSKMNLAAVLRSCSQIYFEARSAFWAGIRVQFDPSFLSIPPFLSQSSKFVRHAITSITLSRQVHRSTDLQSERIYREWVNTCVKLAMGFPHLQEVKVLLVGEIDQLVMTEAINKILQPIFNVGWKNIVILKIRFEGLLAETEAVETLVSLGGSAWVDGSDVVLWRYITFRG